LSSDIEDDNLDNQQLVLQLGQGPSDKTIQTTRVPTPKKRSRADTVIARTSLPTLRHPDGASVSNGSNPLERFRVRVGTGTEPWQRFLPHENPDRCHWAGFTAKNPAFPPDDFASN
jgi:hypothetical protein